MGFHLIFMLGIISQCCINTSAVIRPRKVHVSYPIDLLGTNSDSYSGNLTLDKLTCFGNRDFGVPTYRETLLCMLRLPMGFNCQSIWGSRSVVVEVIGSVEFLKLNTLPHGSVFNELISLNATRWLELTASSSSQLQREVRHVPAEPIYLCARSNDWMGSPAKFHITFRPVFLRERDKLLCHSKILVHIILVIAVTSIWLLPYIAAIVVAALTFMHGIKFIIAIITFSCCIVSLTPLMLTKKNRHLARLYFNYFFTRIQAEETKMVFRQRMPVFQALFFSSALVCIGSGGSYIIYTYCGIDRELRNLLLKSTIGVASSWFVFFLCRSFERFCRHWVWVPMSVCLAQLLDLHLNPLSRDEVVVSTLLISLGISLSFRSITLAAQSKFPQGAGAVAPRLKVWADKVRVSLLSKTMTQRLSFNDADSPVSAVEFVSMAFDEDYVEGYPNDSSDVTPLYGTPRGFTSNPCLGAEDIDGPEDYERQEHADRPAGCRVDSSRALLRVSSDRIDAIPGFSGRQKHQHQQLWETLATSSERSPSSFGCKDDTINGSKSHRASDVANSTTEKVAVVKKSSSSGFLNLFLGSADAENSSGEEEQEEDDAVEGSLLKPLMVRASSFSFFTTSASHRSMNAPPAAAMSGLCNEERNREALSQAVGLDLSVLRLPFSCPPSPFTPCVVGEEIAIADSEGKAKGICAPAEADTNTFPVGPQTSSHTLQGPVTLSSSSSSLSLCPFTHLVGAMSVPLSALGPIRLDRRSLWVPMACGDSDLLNNLQRNLAFLTESQFDSFAFPAEKEYHTSSASLGTCSFADALFVQRWVAHPSNLSLLRSIAKGDGLVAAAAVAEDDYILSASLRGNEVKLMLKILACAPCAYDSEHQEEDHDATLLGESILLAPQLESNALEAVKRVALAAMEDLSDVVSSLALLGLHGTDRDCAEGHFASVGWVGAECTLQPCTLHAMGIISAEQLFSASKLYESSCGFYHSSRKGQLSRVAAAVLSAVGLDYSDIHTIISRCKVEVYVVQGVLPGNVSISPVISGLSAGDVLRRGAKNRDEISHDREGSIGYSHQNYSDSLGGNAEVTSSALSVSLSMPLTVPYRPCEAPCSSEGPTDHSEGLRAAIPPTFSSGPAKTCYDLLAGVTHNTQEEGRGKADPLHCDAASRALAAALLAAHVSQLVDFAQGKFFTSLSNKRHSL